MGELLTKIGVASATPIKWWTAADMPLLVTVDEAARLLRINRRTIYKLVAAGKLKLMKIGPRSSRITTPSLLQFAGVED